MKKVLLQLCILLLCSCGEAGEGEISKGNGYAPGDIIDKTLVLRKSNGDVYLSATHLTESEVLINNSEFVDYGSYPPSYEYAVTGNGQAHYYLSVTRKVYIPYYGNYSYARFTFDVDLNFTSSSKGNYQGFQINGEGTESTISGSFTLN